MAVGSAISSPLGPASGDKDAEALQSIEETTRSANLVQERVSAEILARNADTEYLKCFNLNGATDRDSFKSKLPMISYEDPQPEIQRIANGDRSPILSAHLIPEFLTSVNSDEAVSSTTRLKAFISKAFHVVSTSLKKTVIKVGEPIYKAPDFLLNRRGGGGGGGEGGHGEEGHVEGGDGEEGHVEGGDGEEGHVQGGDGEEGHVEVGDGEEGHVQVGDGEEGHVEDRGGDKKKSRPTPEMLLVIATTTMANTAQTFGSAISLKVRDLALASKVLLILVMANGLAGYLFSITAILLMHKRPWFSRVWVWTGCASTTLGFLILIAAFVLEL